MFAYGGFFIALRVGSCLVEIGLQVRRGLGGVRVFIGARIHAIVRDIQVLVRSPARIAKMPVRSRHPATVLAFARAVNFRSLRVVLTARRTVSVRRRRVRTDDRFTRHVRGFRASIKAIDDVDKLPSWTRDRARTVFARYALFVRGNETTTTTDDEGERSCQRRGFIQPQSRILLLLDLHHCSCVSM